jgi:hypothetical protein
MKKKQVQLPDVTGLTVAVESPAKGQSYQPYVDTAEDHRDDDGHGLSPSSFLYLPAQKVTARLQSAMNLLHKKIAHLDAENHTSRKRMKELERELDICRQDVETQRRLVMLREELLVKQHRAGATTSSSKGKARSVEDTKEEQKRYKQAVEEKKGSQIYYYPSVLCTQRHGDSVGIPHYHSSVSHVPTYFRTVVAQNTTGRIALSPRSRQEYTPAEGP